MSPDRAMLPNQTQPPNTGWRTPPDFFAFCDRTWGPFDLDAAATDANTLVGPRGPNLWPGNTPADTTEPPLVSRHFTEEDNGLVQDWGQRRVWVNPPYGRVANPAWARKFCDASMAGATVVALIPAATDAGWFHDLVYWGAERIHLLKGRIQFDSPEGRSGEGGRNRYSNALAIYTPEHSRMVNKKPAIIEIWDWRAYVE